MTYSKKILLLVFVMLVGITAFKSTESQVKSVMVCKIINDYDFEKGRDVRTKEYILSMHAQGYRLVSLTSYVHNGASDSEFIIIMQK